jgi:hypothetical protein
MSLLCINNIVGRLLKMRTSKELNAVEKTPPKKVLPHSKKPAIMN